MTPQVSLIASAVRPKLWDAFFKSLDGTSVEYEVVFAGNTDLESEEFIKLEESGIFYKRLTYIATRNIKPAQCYEIARRNATGETIIWTADDAEYPNDVIGKAYKYWKAQDNEKLILSIQTRETGYNLSEGKLFDMNIHRFFGGAPAEPYNPLMAPIGLMSRKFLEDLGGFDRRYCAGQYENATAMRAYEHGGTVELFGDKDCFVDIDHLKKSIDIGESKDEKDFLNRPFASSYPMDRKVLETSWTRFNQEKLMKLVKEGRTQIYPNEIMEVQKVQVDKFEQYEDVDLLTKSQSNKGIWY